MNKKSKDNGKQNSCRFGTYQNRKKKMFSHPFITSFSHSHFIGKSINKMIRLTAIQINAYHFVLFEIILPVITNRMNSSIIDDLCIYRFT